MNDMDCTAFLQWALPQLDLRWRGFRKVRGQVCKRLHKRMSELGLKDFAAYRSRLAADPAEWQVLDECCHITISRFFRDRESYTLKILWDLEVAKRYPGVSLSIVATDIDEAMLARAREGCFKPTSLHELPPHLVEQAFERMGPLFCVKPVHREGIDFLYQDLRSQAPMPLFDLILCRYIAFTYFASLLQNQVLARLADRLLPDGYLAIGTHEHLPEEAILTPVVGAPQIYKKASARV